MNTQECIAAASKHLMSLPRHIFDLLTISRPASPEAAVNVAKVISKLSPLVGNLIEFNTVEFLNDKKEFKSFGEWIRQDPGFPDAIFRGSVSPAPGFEIKAWFPLSTEITARFKDSQNNFIHDETYVVILAWLPEHLIYGKPRILDVCIISGLSVAVARDNHYHNPPDYLILEPSDTTNRTRNLRQTNTAGYKWQGTDAQFKKAREIVSRWGPDGRIYKPTREYQENLCKLIAKYPYRFDTNFAKIDRIAHDEIEEFKTRVLGRKVNGMTVMEWSQLLYRGGEDEIRRNLKSRLGITDQNAEDMVH